MAVHARMNEASLVAFVRQDALETVAKVTGRMLSSSDKDH